LRSDRLDRCNATRRGYDGGYDALRPNDILNIKVTPPAQSFTRSAVGAWRPLDQTHLPACQAGNVGFRESNRAPDASGTQVLFNSSPVGDWEFQIVGRRGNVDLDNLADLSIEWQLAAQIVM
jgi:hypothetical protein